MTGQSLLNRMELVNAELQLQSGEADQARGLVALNVAQDYFESILASEPGAKGITTDTGTTNLVTTTSVQYVDFPTGLIRIDSIWKVTDVDLPEYRLDRITESGGYSQALGWPWSIGVVSSTSTGKPKKYWTNGSRVWLEPIPDASYTFRVYGLIVADDITASGTFVYDDIVSFPLAAFAARLMKIGLDDNQEDIAGLAEAAFRPVVKALANFNRDGAEPLLYRYLHET
jgi:hypothetical protein